MKYHITRFFYSLVLSCLLIPCLAAPNITKQKQLWYSYFLTTSFGEKWLLYSEAESRAFFEPAAAQNVFLLRNHLHYKFHKHWDAAVGFAYFLVYTQNPEAPRRSPVIPELRPFEEINNSYTFGRITLTNRIRVEQRFVHLVLNNEVKGGYNFNWRLRYRIGLEVPLFQTPEKKHLIKLKVQEEVMVNAGKTVKNYFDQNRLYAGINYQPPGPLSFEVGYVSWFQQRATITDYYNRHVLRFSIFHKLAFPVKTKGA